MPTGHDLERDVVLTEADVRRPPSSRTMTLRRGSLQQAARVAGAAYLITLALFGIQEYCTS